LHAWSGQQHANLIGSDVILKKHSIMPQPSNKGLQFTYGLHVELGYVISPGWTRTRETGSHLVEECVKGLLRYPQVINQHLLALFLHST